MSRCELDGYLDALARLHGKKPVSAGADNTHRTTRRVKSKRQHRS